MGAGLLSVVTRRDASSIVAAQAPPEAMVSGWPKAGSCPGSWEKPPPSSIGPGLGADAETVMMLRAVLAAGCPVLIDADGLNTLAQNSDLLREARGPFCSRPTWARWRV